MTFLMRLALSVSVIALLLVASGPRHAPVQADQQEAAMAARLIIPSIGVDAVILPTGLTPEGDMAVPDSTVDVGWYDLGALPGQTGSAVIAGHNYWDHVAGVFGRLHQLNVGDALSVTDANGVSTSFVVREMRMYDPNDVATDVFESTSGAHLNLITCSGAWDPATGSFSKRLVVFTDRETARVL